MKAGTMFGMHGQRWVIVRSERGRKGEARTMYVIERSDGTGRCAIARETMLAAGYDFCAPHVPTPERAE